MTVRFKKRKVWVIHDFWGVSTPVRRRRSLRAGSNDDVTKPPRGKPRTSRAAVQSEPSEDDKL